MKYLLFTLLAVFLYAASCKVFVNGKVSYTPRLDDPEVSFAVGKIHAYFMDKGDSNETIAQIIYLAKKEVKPDKTTDYNIYLALTQGRKVEKCKIHFLMWRQGNKIRGHVMEPIRCWGLERLKNATDAEIKSTCDATRREWTEFVRQYNLRIESMIFSNLLDCGTVTSQVVDGVITRFYGFVVRNTLCTKEEGLNSTRPMVDCPPTSYVNLDQRFYVSVYQKATGQKDEPMVAYFQPVGLPLDLGGKKLVNCSDPEIQRVIGEVAHYYNFRIMSIVYKGVRDCENATVYLSEGVNYEFGTLSFTGTNCTHNQGLDSKDPLYECQLKRRDRVTDFHVSVKKPYPGDSFKPKIHMERKETKIHMERKETKIHTERKDLIP